MLVIRFDDDVSEETALGAMVGRYPYTSMETANGAITLVPPEALPFLTAEGIHYTVEGPADYEKLVSSLRNAVAKAV